MGERLPLDRAIDHVDESEYDLFRTSNGRWFHHTALKVEAPPHGFKNTAVRPGGRLEGPQIQFGPPEPKVVGSNPAGRNSGLGYGT
jgi:hypothetical protein